MSKYRVRNPQLVTVSSNLVSKADANGQDRYQENVSHGRGDSNGLHTTPDVSEGRSVQGSRGELGFMEFANRIWPGKEVNWAEIFRYDSDKGHPNEHPDFVINGIPIDIKSITESHHNLQVKVGGVRSDWFYVLVDVGQWPDCVIIGWVHGSNLLKGQVLNPRDKNDPTRYGPVHRIRQENLNPMSTLIEYINKQK